MRVLGHRQREPLPIAVRRYVAVRALHGVPAVVFAATAGRGLKVDLFVSVLADVGDPQVRGRAIEGEAPRIAQTHRPDLSARAAYARERIIRRNANAPGIALDIDAEQLAEQCAAILAVALRVAGRAAVPHSDVQIAVRAEAHLPAVVIGERLGDFEQHDL